MARSSVLVMAAFVASKVVGLLRERAIAHHFGASAEYDAYVAAFAVPDVLFTLIGGGALVSAFLPVFSEALAHGQVRRAWAIASGVTNIVFLLTAASASAAAILAPWVVRYILAPGFDPALQSLTVQLMRLILIGTVIFGVSGLQMGMLNAFGRFLLPALAPVAYNLGILSAAIWLAPRYGIRGLAYGVLLGAALHLAVKLPGLAQCGFRWWPGLWLGLSGTRRVFWLMWPRVLALATIRLAALVTTRLATGLDPGSLSAFNYAWLIAQMPQTVLGSAVGTVVFPTLATQYALRERQALAVTATRALRALVALTVPCAILLWLLARPVVDVLLRTGAFDERAARITALALTMLAIGLFGHVTLEVIARAYYAQQDTWTPFVGSAVAAALNIALAILLVRSMAVSGLALANSLAVSAEVLVLLWWLKQRLPELSLTPLARDLGQALVAAAVMACVTLLALRGLGQIQALNELPPLARGLVHLALGSILGLAGYVAAGRRLGLFELRRGAWLSWR